MFLFLLLGFSTFLSTGNCWLWTTHLKTCIPRYHYWQPYYNGIPPKAYLAGIDRNGDKKYIARVVAPDKRSWSAPTTFSERNSHIFFSWDKHDGIRVDACIEVLCINRPAGGFGWRETTKLDFENSKKACCLVEGGSGYKDGKKIVSYVGRTLQKGVYYIGGVYEPKWTFLFQSHPMHYVDEIGGSHGLSQDFEVLSYDCCTEEYCRKPNKADCCYDIV
ncbi:uncharacterized protein LOC123677649 [Harmonia axyridis]|uniref:uncharacterized protein LOC123677649 n=1 Tax=Harmonia axyridis TaxID=115357 RepID=UPI001E2769FC|nr:uncharacterized protein LOC123677649 [Harmonia axyridis]